MKVCLFGGTFDPPHIGHLLIAQTIIESENFDQFFFIPANITPNKVKKIEY
jgi:nicotinate-nucleotide adenylyltransferase